MTDLNAAAAVDSASSSAPLPLVLAADAQGDAAVLAADAASLSLMEEGHGGDAGSHAGDDAAGELRLLEELEERQQMQRTPARHAAVDAELDEALVAVDLDELTADQVAELESGDAERMAAVLRLKDDARPPADGARAEDGSGLNRVSIKALPPAVRLKLAGAISHARDGGDFMEALREAFPHLHGAEGETGAEAEADPGVGGQLPPGAQEADTAYQPLPEHAGAAVGRLEARLEGMRADYERAKAEYDPQAQELLEGMMDLKLELREARRADEGFMREQQASYERVLAAHPELMAGEESPFMDLCDMTISLAERNNDRILTLPDWPERIAKQVMARFFQGAAARSAGLGGGWPQARSSSTPVPPAPQTRVRLPGSPVGGGFAPGTLSTETALAEFDQLTPEQQEAALAEIARATDGRRR